TCLRIDERELIGRLRLHEPREHPTVRERQNGGPVALDDLPRWFQQRLDQMLAAELAADIRQVGADIGPVLTDAVTARAARECLVGEDLAAASCVSLRLECVAGQLVMRRTRGDGEHDRPQRDESSAARCGHFDASFMLARTASTFHWASGRTSTLAAW